MPKIPIRKPSDKSSDKRTLVDSLLDRIKNNRVAAVVIIACLGIGAIASLTDSTRKLGETLSSFNSKSPVGEWKSESVDFYPFGAESMRLNLQEPVPGQIVGYVQFSGNAQMQVRSFAIVEGKDDGKSLTFSFDNDHGVRESVVGALSGDELRLVDHGNGHAAVSATARRSAQASQLVDGKMGIVYKGKEYPDHRAACEQLLKDHDPPQSYTLSEPSDEWGNVHCVGQEPDGSKGFDQYQNDVQRQLICPANSRVTLVDGRTPKSTKGCECDGDRLASGSQCAVRPG